MSAANDRKEKYQEARKQRKRNREVMTLLGCMVVLVTAFALMIPAISITQDAASRESGFYQSDQQSQTMQVEATIVSDEDGKASEDVSDVSTPAEGTDENASQDEPQAATDDEEASGEAIDATDDDIEDTGSEDANGDNASGKSTSKSGSSASTKAEADDEDKSSDSKMPAQKMKAELSGVGNGETLTVTVEAPEGALPKGVTMTVEEVVDENVLTAAKEAGADAIKDATGEPGAAIATDSNDNAEIVDSSDGSGAYVAKAVAVNITFTDADGNVIEPTKDVRVSLGSSAVKRAVRESKRDAAVAVVHIDDKELAAMAGVDELSEINESHPVAVEAAKNAADVVAAQKVDVDRTREEVAFKASDFSVYVLVYTVDTYYRSYSGDTFKISLDYDEYAGIPEGAELKVREILDDTDEYKKYLEESATKLGTSIDSVSFARFFDIEIVKDNVKIEPVTSVEVKIEFADKIDFVDGKSLSIVHFAENDKGETPEVITDVQVGEDATEIIYEQSSFSVTATIVSGGSLPKPDRENGTKYAIVIEHPETHQYYAVENDGSLVEVAYDSTTGKVTLDYPLEWTYISAHDGLPDNATGNNPSNPYGFNNNNGVHPEWDPYNLRIVADNRTFDSGTQLPLGAYFRYISPVSETGIDEETEEDWHHGTPNGWNSLDGHKWTNGLRYANQRIYDIHWDNNAFGWGQGGNVSNGFYIGADWENMRIIGRQPANNAAIVHMAAISSNDVPAPSSNNETVTHIDIAIAGKGVLDVPLAYGTYYYRESENGPLKEAYTVTSGNDKTLHLEKSVPIDQNDIMKARVHALDYAGNEVPNAYTITGYSSNQTSPYSPVQVRIEGSFKVTTLGPYTGYGRSNDDVNRRNARLQKENQITYQVEVDKDVTFNITDPVYGQLYDMHGTELKTSIKMTLSDGFGYWDARNECPPLEETFEQEYHSVLFSGENLNQIRGRNYRNWKAGAIIDNDWSGNPSYKGDSGMDFVLGNDAESNPSILAVEVVKIIEDEDGNRINPKTNVINNFSLLYNDSKDQAYRGPSNSIHDLSVFPPVQGQESQAPINSEELATGGYYDDYSNLRDFSIDVKNDPANGSQVGVGVYYDYRVSEGMYYVQEDASLVQGQGSNSIITDVNDKKWAYVETRVETEYVWRDNQYNYRKHVADGYSAVPEVLGGYTSDTGNQVRNGFLEFYVYNVYKKVGSLNITKTIQKDGNTDSSATGTFYYAVYSEPYNSNANPAQVPERTGKISITANGSATKLEENLSYGTYYVYELTGENGTPIVSGNNGVVQVVNDVSYLVTGSGSSATVGDNPAQANLTNNHVTNITIDITKVKKGSSPAAALPGAEFVLKQLNEDGSYVTNVDGVVTPQQSSPTETDANGKTSFVNLTSGYYEISESKPPSGYVLTEDTTIYIKIEAGVVTYLNKEQGKTPPQWSEKTNNDTIIYTPAGDDSNDSFTIGNTPGQPLPSTGGMGTTGLTFAGGFLVILAVAILAMERRSRKDYALSRQIGLTRRQIRYSFAINPEEPHFRGLKSLYKYSKRREKEDENTRSKC